MKHQILSFLLIASIGPASLGVPDPKPVMVFDVHRVPLVGELIVAESVAQEVPPHLVLAVIWRESKFQTGARHINANGTVDYGVSQLNDRWFPGAATMTVKENISVSVKYIAALIKRCGTDAGPVIRRAYTTGRCK